MIENILAKDISHDEALDMLSEKTQELIEYYLSISCPCAFPRFLYILGFNARPYANSLAHAYETNVFTNKVKSGHLNFLIQDKNKESIFFCQVCGTEYIYIYEQFSLYFETQRLEVTGGVRTSKKGKDVESPFIFFAGFYVADNWNGDDTKLKGSMQKLDTMFKAGTLREFLFYMKELL